jgi:hypothetical protein
VSRSADNSNLARRCHQRSGIGLSAYNPTASCRGAPIMVMVASCDHT